MQASVFSLGGSRYQLKSKRNRCLWREASMILHLIRQTVNPRVGLAKCIKNWEWISFMLTENPRKRASQMQLLENLIKI